MIEFVLRKGDTYHIIFSNGGSSQCLTLFLLHSCIAKIIEKDQGEVFEIHLSPEQYTLYLEFFDTWYQQTPRLFDKIPFIKNNTLKKDEINILYKKYNNKILCAKIIDLQIPPSADEMIKIVTDNFTQILNKLSYQISDTPPYFVSAKNEWQEYINFYHKIEVQIKDEQELSDRKSKELQDRIDQLVSENYTLQQTNQKYFEFIDDYVQWKNK